MKTTRILVFFPFTLIYGGVTWIRNFLYDIQWFKSFEIPQKSIVIGNLSMGGTGKSPHTLYLWRLLTQYRNIAILSRGYGRKTKGLLEVKEDANAHNVGDEPLMFKKQVGKETLVIVSESRKKGVEWIQKKQKNSIILLDDAFQHRKVKAGFYILLSDFSAMFYDDCLFPSGTLRESKNGAKRADCIIITKCPVNISNGEKSKIKQKLTSNFFLENKKKENIFFSKIEYGELISFGKTVKDIKNVLLVTGIANPQPLEKHLKEKYQVISIVFSDHYQYSREDLLKIHTKFDTFTSENTVIVTTEKDFVKITSILSDTDRKQYPWYYQSITVKLDEELKFNTLINNYVNTI